MGRSVRLLKVELDYVLGWIEWASPEPTTYGLDIDWQVRRTGL